MLDENNLLMFIAGGGKINGDGCGTIGSSFLFASPGGLPL
jgi:hypothetical protein